ncbi:AAA family ATPase [Akkermansiaceae bacterium]|nr:AAA family ATPase [Akkermansiaceae bacterium]
MISELYLQKFKAFGQPTKVPMAPLTFIYGQNSSGKSSILHSIALLMQSFQSSSKVISPSLKDGIVDLGHFREMTFDHEALEKRSSITIGLSLDFLSDEFEWIARTFMPNQSKPVVFDLEYSSWEADALMRFYLGDRSAPLVSFRGSGDGSGGEMEYTYFVDFFELDYESKNGNPFRYLQEWFTANKDFVLSDLEGKLNSEKEVLSTLNEEGSKDRKALVQHCIWEFEAKIKTIKDSGFDFISSDHFSRWADTLNTHIENRYDLDGGALGPERVKKRYRDFSPFRYTWILDFPLLRDDSGYRKNEKLEEFLTEYVGEFIARLRNLEDFFNPAIRQIKNFIVSGASYIGPFRHPPERLYNLSNSRRGNIVGSKGQQMVNILYHDKDLLKGVNKWLRRLGVPYKVKLRILGKKLTAAYVELRLKDLRRSKGKGNRTVEVTLNDVGFGISQILPIVCECVALKNKTIIIEQPELHIHPKLQSNLADLFAWSMKERGNQIIVETHSEHIILRLLRRIRETTRSDFGSWPKELMKAAQRTNEDFNGLKTEEVSVVYVEGGEEGASVTQLPINEEGDFTRPWPGGFFTERDQDLF